MIELWTSVRWRKMEQPDDALLFSAGVSRCTIGPSPVSFNCVVFLHAMLVILFRVRGSGLNLLGE